MTLNSPGMLHGTLTRGPIAHGTIKRIDISRVKALAGIKDVIIGEDTPKIKYGNWRLVPDSQDELPLAVDKIHFVGDEVAAVCALTRETVLKVASMADVE